MSRETDLKLNDDTIDSNSPNDNNNNDDEEFEAELLMDDDDKISARDVRLALCEDKEERVKKIFVFTKILRIFIMPSQGGCPSGS